MTDPKTPALPVDRKRFEKAPCYICGYNGPGYYQPSSHPCAKLYHDKPPALPEPVAYEAFCDASYYDMWCVRPIDERQFGRGFHLINGDEAKALAQMLSDHATQLQEALDRADRAEKEAAQHFSQALENGQSAATWRDRATTAEAALESARKVIEPFATFAENVDADGWTSNIHRDHLSDWFGPSEFLAADRWISANPKETPNADK